MKSLILSFDDAPTADGPLLDGMTRTRKIIAGLEEGDVHEGVFYCNTNRDGIERLSLYSEAGHALGNHTSTHPDLQKVSVDEFKRSIVEAEEFLAPLPTAKKWFRYPYLREAHKDPKKNKAIKDFLRERGYKLGFITVETYDWYLNDLYGRAVKEGKAPDEEKVCALYLRMLFERIEEGMQLAAQVLGRQPPHVLLLHENDLNALFIGRFVNEAKARGFDFPAASAAFSDPITDEAWDTRAKSMRRLEAIAEEKKKALPEPSLWLNEEKIKEAFDGII